MGRGFRVVESSMMLSEMLASSATLTIIFMLCELHQPPTLLWMSLLLAVEMK